MLATAEIDDDTKEVEDMLATAEDDDDMKEVVLVKSDDNIALFYNLESMPAKIW